MLSTSIMHRRADR